MRITRKPRLFVSRAARLAGTQAVLLALGSSLAASAAEASEPVKPSAAAVSEGQELAHEAAAVSAFGSVRPLGWMAAGALLTLALYSPQSARCAEEA